MPSQHGCLFAGNESWTDLNLLLSTRECGQRALADPSHFGLGSRAGARHGCAMLASFSTDAILCHYRRQRTCNAVSKSTSYAIARFGATRGMLLGWTMFLLFPG